MRRISLLLLGAAAAASCSTSPPPTTLSPKAQAHLQELIAGRVAEKPIGCLPHYNANDMIVIDESTIAFKSAGRVYVTHMNGPCSNLGGAGNFALLTRNTGGLGLCSGDIARVVDTTQNITIGSCSFGEFTPYAAPRS